MSGCIPRDRTVRVRLFPLDSCDRIQTGDLAVLDWDGFETITITDQVDQGDRETIQTTSGTVCRDKVACSIDRGQQVAFNECAENWSMLSITGFGSLVFDGSDIVGFDREDLDCAAAVAVEILFELPGGCDTGGAQCLARLYPKVERFTISGDKVVNGKNAIRGTYTGQAVKNANVFGNFTTDTPDGELFYWAPYKTAVNTGDAFYYDRIVDCPTFDVDESCDLRDFSMTDAS